MQASDSAATDQGNVDHGSLLKHDVPMRIVFMLIVVAATGNLSAQTTRASGSGGDWPMWRHDGGIVGYQPLAGAMKSEPHVVAKYFVGASAGASTAADLHGGGKKMDLLTCARGKI